MKKDLVRQVAVLVSVIATIVVNALANALPLNGQTTGAVSNRFDVFFVPSGYVFSIWSLIYIGLLVFTVYQLLPSQRNHPRLRRIGWPVVLSGMANMSWLFLWHYERFILTVIVMFVLLALLIRIYLRLQIGQVRVSSAERWCAHLLFSLYLGWITVATIANISTVLVFLGWNGWGVSPQTWTLIMLAAAVGIASAVSLTRGDAAYMLVLIWAFIGIGLKHSGVPAVSTGAWAAVVSTAVMMIVGPLISGSRKTRLEAA